MRRFTIHLFTVAVALAVIGGSIPAMTASNQVGFALYSGAADRPGSYLELDTASLNLVGTNDLPDGTVDWWSVAVARNGSVSVTVTTALPDQGNTITVRDGFLDSVRFSIDTAELFDLPRLSDDGSRLLVHSMMTCDSPKFGSRRWCVYDTRDGSLISSILAPTYDQSWPELVDPGMRTLYLPFVKKTFSEEPGPTPGSTVSRQIGPWPLMVFAFDLETGLSSGPLVLPDVSAGHWTTSAPDEPYRGEQVSPAIALSPDGSRIAVVDAGIERLTLVDTATLEVVETRSIRERQSRLDRVLRWIGLAPQPASAKVISGRTLMAVFSQDGQSLYLTGSELRANQDNTQIEGEGFGVLRLDVDSGEITTADLAGKDIIQIATAPDGRSIYVLHGAEPWWSSVSPPNPPTVIQRLDPLTLESMAQTDLPPFSTVLMVPEIVLPSASPIP